MLTRDELRETEDFFFDARPCASENEWNIDAPPRSDDTASDFARATPNTSDTRPAGQQGRIMVIGFRVIRV